MPSRKKNPDEKTKPFFTVDLPKVNFSISCNGNLYYHFDYTCKNKSLKYSKVFRKMMYDEMGVSEEEFILLLKEFVHKRMGIKKGKFSSFINLKMTEYVMKNTDNPETRKEMKEILDKL